MSRRFVAYFTIFVQKPIYIMEIIINAVCTSDNNMQLPSQNNVSTGIQTLLKKVLFFSVKALI